MTVIPSIADVVSLTPMTSSWANSLTAYSRFWGEDRPYCWCFSSVGGSAASGAWVPVNYDTNNDDDYGMHSTVTDPSRITPDFDVACTVNIKTFLRFQAHNAAGTFPASTVRWNLKMNLRANSAGDTSLATGTSLLTKEFAPTIDAASNNWASTVLEINRDIDYTPNDYYETFVMQNSGLQLLIDGGGAVTGTQLTVVRKR